MITLPAGWPVRQPATALINPAHPAFQCGAPLLAWNARGGLVEGARGQRLVRSSGTLDRSINNRDIVEWFGTNAGIGRIGVGINAPFSPAALPYTLIFGVRPTSLTNLIGALSCTTDINASGPRAGVLTSGDVFVIHGDGAGTAATNYRQYAFASSIAANTYYSVVAVIRDSTTGVCFVNGVSKVCTPSGTGATYSPGSAGGAIAVYTLGGSAFYGDRGISHAVVIPGDIGDTLAQSISRNPWQLWAQRRQPVFLTNAVASVVAPPAAAPTALGGMRRRHRHYIEIDGELFPVADQAEAVDILERLQETAREEAVKAVKARMPAPKAPEPKITASPDLEIDVEAARQAVAEQYRQAYDAEQAAQEEEDVLGAVSVIEAYEAALVAEYLSTQR